MKENRKLLHPGDVADLANVDPGTVSRWARDGKIRVGMRTMGGHARYYEDEIREDLHLEPVNQESEIAS